MQKQFRRFWSDESGQDLIEYTLLIAFIVIAGMSFLWKGSDSARGIWNTTDHTLTNAAVAAGGGR